METHENMEIYTSVLLMYPHPGILISSARGETCDHMARLGHGTPQKISAIISYLGRWEAT